MRYKDKRKQEKGDRANAERIGRKLGKKWNHLDRMYVARETAIQVVRSKLDGKKARRAVKDILSRPLADFG